MNSSDLMVRVQWAAYLYTALAHAQYEELPDDEGVYAEIPGFQGVWANAPTFDACRAELASTLEDWITVRLADGLDLPELSGLPTPVAA
jgi:predicted RNase H-like HicB family nuclease